MRKTRKWGGDWDKKKKTLSCDWKL